MWEKIARDNQRPPSSDWHVWLIMAGRGFGKTRTGAETVLDLIGQRYKNIAFVGHTIQEGWRVMVNGVSGFKMCFSLRYSDALSIHKTERYIVTPCGAKITVFAGDQYEQLRGPQFDLVWVDELAKFKYAAALWEQIMLSLRLGPAPKCIITTTPKPLPLLHTLSQAPYVQVTKGSTFENSDNLSPTFLKQVQDLYAHTRLGAQELNGELLDHQEGALWKPSMIKHGRAPEVFARKVLAIDPAVSHTGDETGIVIAAKDPAGKGFILADHSGHYTADAWAQKVVTLYHEHAIDCVVAEVNQGGNLIQQILRQYDPHIVIKPVRASHGKLTRAEPIANLYERSLITHVQYFQKLEYQMVNYNAGEQLFSPDRLDAMVWALWSLFLEGGTKSRIQVL